MEPTVRSRIALLLCLTLAFSPALRLLAAEDAAPAGSSATDAVAAVAHEAAASDSGTAGTSAAPATPALPDDAGDAASVGAPAADAKVAPTALPKDSVVLPGPAKPDRPESKYKLSNFLLGFTGGALLCGVAGFLLGTSGPNGIDWEKARVVPVACAVGGGLLGGFASLYLGAHTPEEAKPPMVEGGLPAIGLQASLRF